MLKDIPRVMPMMMSGSQSTNYELGDINGAQVEFSRNKIPETLIKNLSVDGKVITHGYVHGHIHKHKDHTHIHGHIHNHDHRTDLEKINTQINDTSMEPISNQPNFNFSCPALDDLDFCKDVFCNDLDDCFYLNCDDNENSNTCDVNCCDSQVDEICCTNDKCLEPKLEQPPSCEKSEHLECCDDPHCESYNVCHSDLGDLSSVVCTDPNCSEIDTCCSSLPQPTLPSHLENNLCQPQLSKRPIFEDLITNVHLSCKQTQAEEINSVYPPKKKIKRESDFDIHFPHECHQDYKNPSTATATTNHQLHQSCFHTTIPDRKNTSLEYDEKLMSDFDFVIQFNNFNQLLNTATKHEQQGQHEQQEQQNQFVKETTDFNQVSTNRPTLYSCQWENCFKRLNNNTFLNHVIEDHLEKEEIVKSENSNYQCEWNECNFTDNDFNSLINHLKSHQPSNLVETTGSSSLLNNVTNNYALTPLSCTLSNDASPVVALQSPQAPDLNITSVKIVPKNKRKSCKPKVKKEDQEMDLEHTCNWQIGTDDNGDPIYCNIKHQSPGDLHSHLLDVHIGSGKHEYHCCWRGCERHNGKVFTQKQKLIRHIHIHTNFKPCKCDICGASFAVESVLQQHYRVHSGEKPFKCPICDKTFATSSSLSIHTRVHTGERPLVCKWPGCNKRFSESSNLAKHMRIHTKKFNCEACGQSFDKKGVFNRHVLEHSVEK